MFAPVVRLNVLLLVEVEFIAMGWHLHHEDISTAFLNADSDGNLYVK